MHTSLIFMDDQRRNAVRQKAGLNGLDYLDVSADQLTLTVFFLGKAPDQLLQQQGETVAAYKQRLQKSVRIDGGRRIRTITVVDVDIRQARDPRTGLIDPLTDDRMLVRVDRYGDFSTYTLRVIGIEQIDPFYDHLDFTFKIDCPTDLDCLPADTCPPMVLNEPQINYLARDYASFRQLILDRFALIMPEWQERHAPDIGMTLVELLAYVGDHLSYYQDAVATEAYLDTARQRISVRRHARLVDYHLHEGCNARTWVCIETDSDLAGSDALDPQQIFFITNYDDTLADAVLLHEDIGEIPASQYAVFEPMATQPIELYAAHNKISFYTWGQHECCLPRGTTAATLRDGTARERQLHLNIGDVLIFEEVIGPRTGNPADADPIRRHAVRLTSVTNGQDDLYNPPVPIIEITWALDDALPFSLCLSAITDAANGCAYIENISIAHGNVILVDHGYTLEPPEDLGSVPCVAVQATCDCADHTGDTTTLPGRYRPRLAKAQMTFSQTLPVDLPGQPINAAKRLLTQDVRAALPQLTVQSTPATFASDCKQIQPLYRLADLRDPTSLASTLRNTASPIAQQLRSRFSHTTLALLDQSNDDAPLTDALQRALINELTLLLSTWSVQPDLLSSQPDDRHVVVEVDNDGYGNLRYGDGTLGQQPQAGAAFFASYRIGNGRNGNIGAEAISHLVLRNTKLSGGITRVRNPLAASGGSDAEPIAEAKLYAPFALRKELQRAITANDYANLVQRDYSQSIQGAAAQLNWNGSWYEARVSVDPRGSEETSQEALDEIEGHLDRLYRRIGHDLQVTNAIYVPVDIAIRVCVLPNYLRGHVQAALLDVFSQRILPNGRRGFFHPDNLTFGAGIYLSQLIAAAQAITGVESVSITKLERLYAGSNGELEQGVLTLGPLELARMDNDPNFPEHGRLMLDLRGGR